MSVESGAGAAQGPWAWFEELRGCDLSDAEVESAAERLLADRERVLPLLLAQFTDPEEDAGMLAVATVALRAWKDPYPTQALIALLQSREVGALPKALIMSILDVYGVDVEGSDLFGVGINLDDYEPGDGHGNGRITHN